MSMQYVYICDLCKQRFRREDHLRRHRLSHGKAKFQCTYDGCAMAFHRKDVLNRHMKVHIPDPSVKRRRPRRGIEPRPFVQAKVSLSDEFRASSQETHSSQSQSSKSESSSSISFEGEDVFDDLPADALAFCSLHFTQSCMQRFTFIHHSSLDRETMPPEKLLAMAVLGGCGIPQYDGSTKWFFERAKVLFQERLGTSNNEDKHACICGHGVERSHMKEDLSLLQAQVLLIEYALWSQDGSDRNWAISRASYLASEAIPKAVAYVKSIRDTETDWSRWVLQEEYTRTLWAFYCTTQKARVPLLGYFSTLEVQRDLNLPEPDAVFNAPDELTWQQVRKSCLIEGKSVVNFKQCFSVLITNAIMHEDLLQPPRPLAIHVLLSALLDQLLTAFATPSNFESYKGYCNRRLTQFKPRENLRNVLATCKEVWWKDPAGLFAACPPKTAELQNSLLLKYLVNLMYGGADENCVLRKDYLTAVRVSYNSFSTMIRNNVLEVATKARWLTDGASKYFAYQAARTLIEWAHSLQRYPKGTPLDDGDQSIYSQCCDSLLEFNSQFSHFRSNVDLSDPNQMEQSLHDAWTIILQDREFLQNSRLVYANQ